MHLTVDQAEKSAKIPFQKKPFFLKYQPLTGLCTWHCGGRLESAKFLPYYAAEMKQLLHLILYASYGPTCAVE